jgi:hypothetical protein
MAKHYVKLEIKKVQWEPEKIKEAIHKRCHIVMKEIIEDLAQVASDLAPHKTGLLEKSFKRRITKGKHHVEGKLGFSAIGKEGYDYAVPMHEGTYNLGEGSKIKAVTVKPKSKFGAVHHSLGRKFLEAPAYQLAPHWRDYLEQELIKELQKLKVR